MSKKLDYIIDTDPGVDDALALMLAIKAGMNIPAITTVYGNVALEKTTKNTLSILEILNSSIPVYKGTQKPLNGSGTLASSHGSDGLGNFSSIPTRTVESASALTYLSEIHRPTTVICLGPTTTYASLFRLQKSSKLLIEKIIVLGGVLGQKGNISPYAEFNVYNDPVALQELLTSSVPITLIPINICREVQFTTEDFKRITNKTMRDSIQIITEMYIQYYTSKTAYGTFSGGVMYDLLAVAFALDPLLFSTQHLHVEVSVTPGEQIGQTTVVSGKQPNCQVITSVDAERLKNLFFTVMSK